jgi:predicted RNase H-like HicB family nuclease
MRMLWAPGSCYNCANSEENWMRYTVVLEAEADGGYVASVPALPGCVGQGNSCAEVLGKIQDAIELCIGDRRASGCPSCRWRFEL